jgi:PAS domain S-box-containing protein
MACSEERGAMRPKHTSNQRPELPRQLHAAADGFRRIVESLPIPLTLLRRADGKILYTNPALDNLFGMDAARLWDHNSDFLFPRLRDRRRLRELLKSAGHVSGEQVNSRRRDGTELWLSVWQKPLVCEDAECVLTVLVDVTRRKALEDQKDERLSAVEQVLQVTDRERQLIAYEIHDGFVQQMLTALMQLDAYRWSVEQRKPKAEQKLDAVIDALRQGAAEARQLIDRVRPPDLAPAGLVGALRTLTQRLSQSSGIPIELTIAPAFPCLTPESELAVYRIVQECLTNIQRHSQSERARVELNDGGEDLRVVIRDWGVGFDPSTVGEGHYGLLGVRERVRLIGGTLKIDSNPGAGVCITLKLPREIEVATSQVGRSDD